MPDDVSRSAPGRRSVLLDASRRLQEYEHRVRRALTIDTVGVLFFRLDGRITDANDAFARMSGYTRDELLQSVQWPGLTAPEFQEVLTCARADLVARGDTPAFERQMVRKDGSRWWGLAAPKRIAGRGVAAECVEFVIDISERHDAEARLQRMLDELDDRVRERTSELAAANAALEQEVREHRAAEAQIKELFKRLVNAHEEERRAVARDIHDQLGQQMTALRMNLDALRTQVADNPQIAPQVERVQQLAEEVDSSVDALTWQLRPSALDHLGLSAALAQLVHGWSERFHIRARYQTVGADRLRFAPEVRTNVYRLVQEALHNVFKHAHATEVGVLFERRGNRAVIVIEDDGRGFDPAHPRTRSSGGGLGLVGMRERARLIGGDLEVESSPGQGTTVFVRVPITVEGSERRHARRANEDSPG